MGVMSYEFRVGPIMGGAAGAPAVALTTTDGAWVLPVRVCVTDAQMLAAACAGVVTPATRLAALACSVAEQLETQASHILLQRNDSRMITASLILVSSGETLAVPLTFSDAIVVALARQLPLHGDESLAPLLRPAHPSPQVSPSEDAEIALPPMITAFLHSLDNDSD